MEINASHICCRPRVCKARAKGFQWWRTWMCWNDRRMLGKRKWDLRQMNTCERANIGLMNIRYLWEYMTETVVCVSKAAPQCGNRIHCCVPSTVYGLIENTEHIDKTHCQELNVGLAFDGLNVEFLNKTASIAMGIWSRHRTSCDGNID